MSCDEATEICNKNQYKEASFFELIKLRMHVLLCKHCRQYSKQNSFLSRILGLHSHKCEEMTLTETEKVQIKEKIEEFDK